MEQTDYWLAVRDGVSQQLEQTLAPAKVVPSFCKHSEADILAVCDSLARKSFKPAAMAYRLGYTVAQFAEIREFYPSIDVTINRGYSYAAEALMDLTWMVATDNTSKSQRQELDRLHRINKTDEAKTDTPSQVIAPTIVFQGQQPQQPLYQQPSIEADYTETHNE